MAPLVVTATKELIGPVLIVSNGPKTIGVTSSELMRPWQSSQLSIATSLDGEHLVAVASWGLGRYSGIALVELSAQIPDGPEVSPLPIGAVCATVETRGAPSAIVTFSGAAPRYVREVIPAYVDSVDTSGGMSDDVLSRLATPIEAKDLEQPIDGGMVFAWFPPDPVLGRKSEVLVVAMTYPYLQRTFKPRDLPAIAELIGLDDLGRALISSAPVPERAELAEITGEIASARDVKVPVLDGVDEYRKKRERT